jgi:hypothetical protein
MHGAFALNHIKGLIGIVTMHLIFLSWLIVMHPGMKPRRVEDVLAPFFFMGQIDNVDTRKSLRAVYFAGSTT